MITRCIFGHSKMREQILIAKETDTPILLEKVKKHSDIDSIIEFYPFDLTKTFRIILQSIDEDP